MMRTMAKLVDMGDDYFRDVVVACLVRDDGTDWYAPYIGTLDALATAVELCESHAIDFTRQTMHVDAVSWASIYLRQKNAAIQVIPKKDSCYQCFDLDGRYIDMDHGEYEKWVAFSASRVDGTSRQEAIDL